MSRVIGNLALHLVVMQVISVAGNIKITPAVPEVTQSATLSCYMSPATSRMWRNNDNSITVVCGQAVCSPPDFSQEGYTFQADNEKIQIIFQTLSRARDEQIWTCWNSTTIYNASLLIYTIPQGLEVSQVPMENVDLSMTLATLSCRTTSCTYPKPSIQWLYKLLLALVRSHSDHNDCVRTGILNSCNIVSLGSDSLSYMNVVWNNEQPMSSKYEMYTTSTPSGTADSCILPEKIYSNSLQLAQNTTLTDNSDKNVTFSCMIGYSDPFKNITTSFSRTVRFAVRVTEAVLQQNNQNITNILNVTSGEPVSLTCLTGTSRPRPIIEWFLGSESIGSGDSLNFTPRDDDHNAMVYCTAYNTKPNPKIYSNTSKLYVRVFVRYVNISGATDILHKTPATFICNTSVSRPDATVRWFIGNTEMTTGIQSMNKTDNGLPYVESSLTFDPDGFSDHGQEIYCQAYTMTVSDSVTSTKLILSVKVYVNSITLNPPGPIVTFLDGTENSLRCTTSPCRPQPSIRWWLNGNEVTYLSNTTVTTNSTLYVASSELRLTLDKTQQDKNVYCDARVNGQVNTTESTKPAINVWFQPSSPSVQTFQGSFPWLENRTGTLQCVTEDYGNPRATVMWKSSRGTEDMDGRLVLKNLNSHDHEQTVYCQLRNNFTVIKGLHVVSSNITLNVEYSPKIQFNTTSALIVNETQFLIVSCNATGNPNPNQLFWSERPAGSLLRFENISRNDNGTYTCNALATTTKHGTLRNQTDFNIIVQYAPVVIVTDTSSTLQNTTSWITCEASGFPTEYTFYPWKHMWGETIIRSGLRGMRTEGTSPSQNILKLERLSLQDMGTYVCFVENRIKGIDGEFIQTAAVDLNILGIPSFLSAERDPFTGEIGHVINISIPFYSYSIVTSFVFKRNGTVVMNTSRTSTHVTSVIIEYMLHDSKVHLRAQEAHLYIQNLTEEDFDNYTLILENSLGPAEFLVTLDPFGPPLMVERFYLNRLENQVQLHFDPGFNGGRIQVFVIQYKSEASLDAAWKNASILQETQTQYRLPNGTFTVNVTKPSPGSYIYRMFSWNEIDRSPYSPEIRVFIPEGIKTPPDSPNVAIAGGIGAAVLVIAVVAVVIIVINRRNKSSDEELTREIQKQERPESGLIDNPVYDTSENLPSPSTSTDAIITEYSVVVKPKHNQKAAKIGDPNNVYAQVDKKKKKTDRKGASKGKLGKVPRGDIYENATIVKRSTSKENVYENSESTQVDSLGENMYENPGTTAAKDPVVSNDDLHYADLMLGPPTTKAGKPVIHGLENRTEYAQIAYGKRGEPLPESDEEQDHGGAKKNTSTKLNTDE